MWSWLGFSNMEPQQTNTTPQPPQQTQQRSPFLLDSNSNQQQSQQLHQISPLSSDGMTDEDTGVTVE